MIYGAKPARGLDLDHGFADGLLGPARGGQRIEHALTPGGQGHAPIGHDLADNRNVARLVLNQTDHDLRLVCLALQPSDDFTLDLLRCAPSNIN